MAAVAEILFVSWLFKLEESMQIIVVALLVARKIGHDGPLQSG
jgi:hypothetical protein